MGDQQNGSRKFLSSTSGIHGRRATRGGQVEVGVSVARCRAAAQPELDDEAVFRRASPQLELLGLDIQRDVSSLGITTEDLARLYTGGMTYRNYGGPEMLRKL